MPKASDIIAAAYREINVLPIGEPLPSDLGAQGLEKLQQLLDLWSAKRINVYNVNFNSYTLIPNLSPHTIGPSSATFTVAMRPAKIENANIILNTSTPNVKVPVFVRDDDWWAKNRVPGVATSIPTDLYYSPGIPNGSLYLWPVPNFAYLLELETWALLTQVAAISDNMTLPPGYWSAIVKSLAVDLLPNFPNLQPSPLLIPLAQRALATIQANNAGSPRCASTDSGQPKMNTGGDFNYYTGNVR